MKKNRFERIQKTIEDRFIKNLEMLDISSKERFLETFPSLWKKKKRFEEHVLKRVKMKHIISSNPKLSYARKIINVLYDAEDIYIEKKKSGVQVDYVWKRNWIVIIGENGKIETAYKLETDLQTFLERHKIKNEIYRGKINEKFRKTVKSLWNRVELF